MPSDPLNRLKEDRERLRELHAAGASGLKVARDLSASMDLAIAELWGTTASDVSVIAVGGYGTSLLAPFSDIDLLVLKESSRDFDEQTKELYYRLWDAGIELGFSARTQSQALKMARRDFHTLTAYIQARLVVGSQALFASFKSRLMKHLRKSRTGFREDLIHATLERRPTSTDSTCELEPDLKNGRGGLRDFASLLWLASLDDQVPSENITRSATFLMNVRNELHWATGRRTDRLRMEHQPKVARALGLFQGGEFLSPEDQFMRSIYRNTRTIAFALESELFPDDWSPDRSSRSGKAVVLEAVHHGRRAFEVLEATAELTDLIPEWRHISCLPQRSIYHQWTVDTHSIEAAVIAGNLEADSDEFVKRVAREAASERELLIAATLFHDLGKGSSEDHSSRGERLARPATERLGFTAPEADLVAWLVANHLLLSETATRRDLNDENLIVRLAEMVEGESRLRLLFLVSVADGRATSPSAWSEWKASLVTHLFTELHHVISAGELVGKRATQTATKRTKELLLQLQDVPRELIYGQLEAMPRAWLLSREADALEQDTRLMSRHPGGHEEATISSKRLGPAGMWEVTVVAGDRPGLFSAVSGVLSLHGLSVVSAEAYTRSDQLALEIFHVMTLSDESRRFENVSNDVKKVLLGSFPLGDLLAAKRRDHSAGRSKGRETGLRVRVDNHASDFYSVIEVHASDRVGLLYDITRTLTDFDLNIHLAKVATYGDDVVDVFYVRSASGERMQDDGAAEEIKTAIERLSAAAGGHS